MKIILSQEESLKFFYNALCNGLDYVCSGYSLSLYYTGKDYKQARDNLSKELGSESFCFEDVLIQILKDGNKLTLIDEESDEKHAITLDDVYNKVSEAPVKHLLDMVNEHDDAVTADVILQTVFLGEIVFG